MYLKLRKECFTFLKVTWSKWAFYLLYRSCVRIYTDSDFWFVQLEASTQQDLNAVKPTKPLFDLPPKILCRVMDVRLQVCFLITHQDSVDQVKYSTNWLIRPWLMEGSSSGAVLSTSIINLCLLIRVYLTFFFVVSELLKAKNMFLNTLRTFH